MNLIKWDRNKIRLAAIIIVIGIILCISAADKHKEKKRMESQYNQAKELYYLERYEEALIILYEIPEYSGSADLVAKAEAQLELRIQKERLQSEYETQLAEETKRTEILGTGEAVTEPDISEQMPYVGMDEVLLSDTMLGTAYYYGANSEHIKGKRQPLDIYYYYDGNSVIFAVRVFDDKVYDVHDYREKPWNRSQIFKNHPFVDGVVQGGKITEDHPVYSDPYDVELYDDPDDFAWEWADEFDSYDDAYEYWCDYYNK